MIAIDFSKQQALDADPKAIQQITFAENADRAASATMIPLMNKQNQPF